MHMKNVWRSRRAISPILATLLLIVIVVAAIVVTYAWIMTYMGNAGQQAGVMLTLPNTRFYIDGSTKKMDIDVQNTGTSDTQIIKIYAGPAKGNLAEQIVSPTLPLALNHNSIVTMTISYNWTAGGITYFTIVPSSGAPLTEMPEQAPLS